MHKMVLRVYTALALAFLLLPIFVIIPLSFSNGTLFTYPIHEFSLRWYREALRWEPWLHALRNSAIIATGSSVAVLAIGTLAAYGLARMRSWFAGFALAILIAPLVVPIVVTALGLYFFFSDLGLGQSFLSLGLGHMVLAMPVTILPILATLKRFDWDLVRASASLGARPPATFWYIILPMIAPGILTAAILAFITSFDEIVVALFLAPAGEPTLPKQLFTSLRDRVQPSIVAIAAMLMLISICFLLAMELVLAWTSRTQTKPAA